jgi:hypothetical protein
MIVIGDPVSGKTYSTDICSYLKIVRGGGGDSSGDVVGGGGGGGHGGLVTRCHATPIHLILIFANI